MAPAWSGLIRSYPEVPLATACLLLLAFVYHQTRRRSATPTNWPILGMLPGLLANLGHFHDWITSILRESGCTFEFRGPWLLGMDFLITCDPANVNHVFNVNFSNYPKGQEFLEIFEILGDGIFNADHESWKIQRRLAHGVMSGPGFRAFVAERSRDKVEGSLVPLMAKLARRGDAVDLQDVFLRLTFDMTCELVFGVDPGCLSEGFPTIPFARAMDDAMEALFFRHVVPSPCWRLMRLLQIGKYKHKGKSSRVNGSERKHGNRRTFNKTPEPLNVRFQGNSDRLVLDCFGKSKAVDVLEYGISGQEAKCGSSFLKEALPEVHLPFGEAS